MDMTIRGLTPNASYNINVVLFAKVGEESGFGVNAGFTSGALTTFLASDGYDATPGGAVTGGNWRIPIGSTSADALGDLHVFLDNDDPEFAPRTEIDGVIYSLVPEPNSLSLLALGTLSVFGLRRRSA